MQQTAEAIRSAGKRIAVVPTMGSLHEGHLSLIRLAREHADVVVTTIFVNPTQFGPSEDFARYPRNVELDVRLAASAGADHLFAPETEEMYPTGYRSFVEVGELGDILEGKSRPGHFRGVATVVAKLFHVTLSHVAVFGQKDAQQVAVIRRMVEDLNFHVQLVVGPIVREPDGLAMSSRNVYLTSTQRNEAAVLHRSLRHAEEMIHRGIRDSARIVDAMAGMISEQSSGTIDYISIADASSLKELASLTPRRAALISLAVRFGTTRLIDNAPVMMS